MTRTTSKLLCIVLVLLSAVGGAGAAGAADEDANVTESVVAVHEGSVAEIPIELSGTDTATIRIGGREVGYAINATVTDGNGDGTVVLLFDTAAAGRDGATLSTKAGADSSAGDSETELKSPLDPGHYEIHVYPGEDTTGEETDAAALVLQDAPETTTAGTTVVTPTETTTRSTDATDPSGATENAGGQPGFGVRISLVALLGVVIAARRRD